MEEREREPLERRGLTRRELMIKGGGAAGAISLAWLLAACGGGGDETAEPAAPPAEEPAGTEPAPPATPPATETVPSRTASAVGPLPTGIVAASDAVAALTFETVESSAFATQTPSSSTASAAGHRLGRRGRRGSRGLGAGGLLGGRRCGLRGLVTAAAAGSEQPGEADRTRRAAALDHQLAPRQPSTLERLTLVSLHHRASSRPASPARGAFVAQRRPSWAIRPRNDREGWRAALRIR